MVFILAAGSLHHAIKTAPQLRHSCYKHNVYALLGLVVVVIVVVKDLNLPIMKF